MHKPFRMHYVHSIEIINRKTGSTLCNMLHYSRFLFILNGSTCSVSLTKSCDLLMMFIFCYISYDFSMNCAVVHLFIIILSIFDVCQLDLLNLPLHDKFILQIKYKTFKNKNTENKTKNICLRKKLSNIH